MNLRAMARFHVPIIVTVTGEGGSGGALALGIGDRVLMLEHSIYSVISPEGCAAILWKDAAPQEGRGRSPQADGRRPRRARRHRRDRARAAGRSARRSGGRGGRRRRGGRPAPPRSGRPDRRGAARAPLPQASLARPVRDRRRSVNGGPAESPRRPAADDRRSRPRRDTVCPPPSPKMDSMATLADGGRRGRRGGTPCARGRRVGAAGAASAAARRPRRRAGEGLPVASRRAVPRPRSGCSASRPRPTSWSRRPARGKRVVVFGDYDVDGVTAVAQLRAALGASGAESAAFIPHRLRDGYGLKPETVRRVLAELSPAAIVTVDCGITAVEGVACARRGGRRGHRDRPPPGAGRSCPAGAIVVNPRQPGCAYPEKELAATGIAMKIAQAVARRAGVRLSPESLLRAACLGHDRRPRSARRARTARSRPPGWRRSRRPALRACAPCSRKPASPRARRRPPRTSPSASARD